MAASNVQKTPLAASLNQLGIRSAETRIQRLPQCLPCSVVSVSGSIVTVKFEVSSGVMTLPQVQMPLFGPEYIRYPMQVGDKGFAIASDAYLGQMSGLGTGTADLSEQPNLSTLSFMPIGNMNFSATDDANKVVIYGPNGTILRDKGSHAVINIDQGGTITITGDLHVSGAVIAGFGGGDQVGLQTHRHGTVSPASGTVTPSPGT